MRQKYEAPASQTTSLHSFEGALPLTVGEIDMPLSVGTELEQLFMALMDRKDSLHEQAAYHLAEHMVNDYLDLMDQVQAINVLLNEIFWFLNERMEMVATTPLTQQQQQAVELVREKKKGEILSRLSPKG